MWGAGGLSLGVTVCPATGAPEVAVISCPYRAFNTGQARQGLRPVWGLGGLSSGVTVCPTAMLDVLRSWTRRGVKLSLRARVLVAKTMASSKIWFAGAYTPVPRALVTLEKRRA